MSHQHTCSFCDKKYTRKSSHDRHIIVCKILQQSKREKICDLEESTNLPTYKQLYNIVQELGLKYSILETKMEEVQKWVDKKKKKLNVIQWLNTNSIPSHSYEEWISSIVINKKEIEILLEDSLVKTFTTVLQNNLDTFTTNNPIACFSEKANMLYIYEKDKEWIHFESPQFVILIKKIHSKIFSALFEWKNQNKEKIQNEDKWADLYTKTLSKLTSMNFTHDSNVTCKIRTGLYNYLKSDLKRVIEYEFEF